MPVEMGVWRIDEQEPRRLTSVTLPSEKDLEVFLERDPSLLGEKLLVIGRQVRTPHGKYIDLLGMDVDGNLNVLELKREKTPRDVVAQLLDYGSWVSGLDRDAVIRLAGEHLRRDFEVAFEQVFGVAPPDEINSELRLTIVTTDLDASTERIVGYLREFRVPINAVFFSYLEDGDRQYLARSWLASAEEGATGGPGGKKGKLAEWNGRDWFVSFGEGLGRSWDDGLRYGFVSAGGDPWYSRTLRTVPVGARVWVHLPKAGYVAVGVTLGEAVRFDQARVMLDEEWVHLADQPLNAPYLHGEPGEVVTDDNAEYVLPVRWLDARPKAAAYWEKGMFANQNSACKLRQQFTLERLGEHFASDQTDAD